ISSCRSNSIFLTASRATTIFGRFGKCGCQKIMLRTRLPTRRCCNKPATRWKNQFATYKIENPEYIAIWLDGYYHGTRGDMKVDIQTLSADVKMVEMYCLSKPEVPLVQAVKTGAGHLCWALMGLLRIWPSRWPLGAGP